MSDTDCPAVIQYNVDDTLNSLRAQITSVVGEAKNMEYAIRNLIENLHPFNPGVVTPTFPDWHYVGATISDPKSTKDLDPVKANLDAAVIKVKDALALVDPAMVTIPSLDVLPAYTGAPPTLTNPLPPILTPILEPTEPTNYLAFSMPTPPSLTYPAPAVMFPITPNLNMPTITLPTLPTFKGERVPIRTVVEAFSNDWYSKEKKDVYTDSLVGELKRMLNGQDLTFDNTIWGMLEDQVKDETAARFNSAEQTVSSEWAARGFSMPPGALDGKLRDLRFARLGDLNKLDRNIVVERAKMVQENLFKAIAVALQHETLFFQAFDSFLNRELSRAQYVTNANVALANALTQQYAVDGQVFNSLVQAYNGLIQAELAKYEPIKLQLQIEQTKVSANQSLIQQYTAELQAITTRIDIYKSEVQAQGLIAEHNKQLLDQFRSRIELVGEKLKVDGLKIQNYTAQLGGDQTRASIYATEVGAWSSLQNGVTARNNSLIQRLQGTIDVMKAMFEKANLAAQAEKIQADVYGVQLGAEAQMAQVDARNYEVLTGARLGSAKNLLEQDNIETQRSNIALQGRLSYNQTMTAYMTEFNRLQIAGLTAMADILKNIASGALAAVSVRLGQENSAQMSVSCQRSFNYSLGIAV